MVHHVVEFDLNPAVGQPDLPVGPVRQFLVVSDDDKGLVFGSTELPHEFMQSFSRTAIQIAGRFVSQNDLRLVEEGPGQSHSLQLPTGELTRFVVFTLGQTDFVEQLPGGTGDIPERSAVDDTGHDHIFKCRELRQEMMKLEHKSYVGVAKVSQSVI